MKNMLQDTLTLSEASKMWGLDHSTIGKMIKTDKLVENYDYRRSAGTWLIKKDAMEKVYGKKNDN